MGSGSDLGIWELSSNLKGSVWRRDGVNWAGGSQRSLPTSLPLWFCHLISHGPGGQATLSTSRNGARGETGRELGLSLETDTRLGPKRLEKDNLLVGWAPNSELTAVLPSHRRNSLKPHRAAAPGVWRSLEKKRKPCSLPARLSPGFYLHNSPFCVRVCPQQISCFPCSENEALWREVASLRQKHAQQQKVVNKLIQFLISLVQSNRILGVKRKIPLMLNDSSSAHSMPKYSRQYSLEHVHGSSPYAVSERGRGEGVAQHPWVGSRWGFLLFLFLVWGLLMNSWLCLAVGCCSVLMELVGWRWQLRGKSRRHRNRMEQNRIDQNRTGEDGMEQNRIG
ncbi:uncharacterized protein LOC125691171 isoform X4 [Lagopus muta]|uniref:uncharacterized protein LOC125691171 isoform X1 n=1 Tax=Lagopus muta TaxID=64668 RepID=UPI0020A0772B|nr:uncharacterized protein LOC125691171 isoform X1 [Lagopus muta]XP_048796157.1 uncharacterized protein LOC125691171 isoform X2 [Lagopus muta]XP_048796158.1 uncharacterized protein LOC125691171 isoform X3 [Lagopus muta]XP_048796159.1 uncharacterized protein LOC125691171 isoform X4 [Lagopus muta]